MPKESVWLLFCASGCIFAQSNARTILQHLCDVNHIYLA
jgi:hypothetical protein